ncbi:helix-turn-helix domain-containing protein [Secundilactobacillus similis]|uniref:helix-turn-helix domain-containing protein n=1 Tax=Secundilactobacillus similis TaxID=414682 RepID=UPI0006D26A7A|nr:LysR family transcriptional regulator [Secundilactobacillus similis]
MDVTKLNTFVDLAETLNYTQTAARLFTTQATVSKQILALEKELDTTLVDRSHRQIELTWLQVSLAIRAKNGGNANPNDSCVEARNADPQHDADDSQYSVHFAVPSV